MANNPLRSRKLTSCFVTFLALFAPCCGETAANKEADTNDLAGTTLDTLFDSAQPTEPDTTPQDTLVEQDALADVDLGEDAAFSFDRIGQRCPGWQVTHAIRLDGELTPLPEVGEDVPGTPKYPTPFAYGTWTLVADSTVPTIGVYCLGSGLLCGQELLDQRWIDACTSDDVGFCALYLYLSQCNTRILFLPWNSVDLAYFPAQEYRCVTKVSQTTGKATSTPSCLAVPCDTPSECVADGICRVVAAETGNYCYVSKTESGLCCETACVPIGTCKP